MKSNINFKPNNNFGKEFKKMVFNHIVEDFEKFKQEMILVAKWESKDKEAQEELDSVVDELFIYDNEEEKQAFHDHILHIKKDDKIEHLIIEAIRCRINYELDMTSMDGIQNILNRMIKK